ncbi:MAG: hypothetical protein WB799_18295 [Candidatus Sulfotelmatobacter sp.]
MSLLDEIMNEQAQKDGQPQPQATPLPLSQPNASATPNGGSLLDQIEAEVKAEQNAASGSTNAGTPPVQPYNLKVHGEYTTPENYAAWSNQPTDARDPKFDDKKQWKMGERTAVEEAHGSAAEDAASAVNVNHLATVGGVTVGAAPVIAEALPSVLMHTAAGVKALNAWALKNPVSAIMLYHAVKELIPGAKKAMGIIKATPIPD